MSRRVHSIAAFSVASSFHGVVTISSPTIRCRPTVNAMRDHRSHCELGFDICGHVFRESTGSELQSSAIWNHLCKLSCRHCGAGCYCALERRKSQDAALVFCFNAVGNLEPRRGAKFCRVMAGAGCEVAHCNNVRCVFRARQARPMPTWPSAPEGAPVHAA